MPHKIIIDTDIGEDIDDILVTAFALVSPEFEVLAITTTDGDTQARSRIARKVVSLTDNPDTLVVAGSQRAMPHPNDPYPPGTAVTQGELAPTEDGLPAACDMEAADLIALLAARHPGEVTVVTIGSMANVGWALVKYPRTAERLRAIVTNGGNFGPGRETNIGWNLRYDPVAAVTVAMSRVRWVLLPENCTRFAGLREEDVAQLQEAEGELPRLLAQAIFLWKQNKPDATPLPHVSDMNVFAYLLGGWVETAPGRVSLTLTPGRLPALQVEEDPEGPHLLGGEISRERGAELRALFMSRILGKQ